MVVGEFTTEVDVVVIGAGPGGYVAAIRLAQLGKNVTLIDKDALGGVCLNRGCIPSKALIAAAHRYEEILHSTDNQLGIKAEGVSVDFAQVQAWKDGIVQKLTSGVESLLKANKVTILPGEALFMGENEIRVINGYEAQRYRFNQCIIATGSRAIELPAFPFGKRVLSSTEALTLAEIPKSMVVIGGGYIGIELGQTYAKFGTKVTILEGENQILPIFEKQLAQMVEKNLQKNGVEIITQARAEAMQETENDLIITYQVGEEKKQIEAEYLLVTVGRKANTEELGLEAAQVKLDEHGLVVIDEQCRTSNPTIYAIGDIVAGPALAHKASYEAKVAAEAIAGKASSIDYKVIPSVVFSDPEIAIVGLTEQAAKEEGLEIIVGRFPFGANGRALSLQATEGFVKLIAEKESTVLLGAQVVGASASELIAELTLAIEMGATLEDIALTIHAHPTLGEISMEAAEVALGQPIHTVIK